MRMFETDPPRCAKKCVATGEEFQPGQTVFSVLVAEGAKATRRDYCEAAWEGPPENSIGWWKSKLPEAGPPKPGWAPNDVMLQYFQNLEGDADKADIRYVLALLMIRRRIVRVEESAAEALQNDVMIVYSPKDETQHEVAVATPSPQRVEEIQEELAELLFTNVE